MVKVRLSRAGAKKRPYYHIVVTDKEKAPRRALYRADRHVRSQSPPSRRPPSIIRASTTGSAWGAQVSDRVRDVVKEHKKAAAAAAPAS